MSALASTVSASPSDYFSRHYGDLQARVTAALHARALAASTKPWTSSYGVSGADQPLELSGNKGTTELTGGRGGGGAPADGVSLAGSLRPAAWGLEARAGGVAQSLAQLEQGRAELLQSFELAKGVSAADGTVPTRGRSSPTTGLTDVAGQGQFRLMSSTSEEDSLSFEEARALYHGLEVSSPGHLPSAAEVERQIERAAVFLREATQAAQDGAAAGMAAGALPAGPQDTRGGATELGTLPAPGGFQELPTTARAAGQGLGATASVSIPSACETVTQPAGSGGLLPAGCGFSRSGSGGAHVRGVRAAALGHPSTQSWPKPAGRA